MRALAPRVYTAERPIWLYCPASCGLMARPALNQPPPAAFPPFCSSLPFASACLLQILPEFFKHFWVRRMALDRRNYRALVETTVEVAGKVSLWCLHHPAALHKQ